MTPTTSLQRRLLNGDLSIIFYISLVKLVVHLIVNFTGGYGLFRDEFYYVACSQNLAAGYVDQPPLCAFVLRLVTAIFGDSLFVIRFVPALAMAGTVFFTGLISMKLGGKKLATFIACLLSFSAINLAMGTYYSMNSLDILIWTVAAYVVVRIVQDGNKKWWILLGIVLGVGLLNKIGVFFLGAGIFVGLLATRERKWFLTTWPYITGAIAFVFFLPYVIWNIQHDFAHLEFIRNASEKKYSSLSMLDFLTGQILINNPLAALIWIPGLVALFISDYFKAHRILGWMYVIPLLIFVVNGTSKPEYLAPAYGILFAAGGVFWERLVERAKVWRYALTAVLALWVLLTILAAPIVLPFLPVETYIRYSEAIGFKPESPEGKEQSELPQFYADMFGWKEKVEGVAKVFHSLTPEEQKRCAIYASNYGRCGAVDYYAKDYGLPKTIGDHNNYWIWGPRGYTGDIVIIMGGDLSDHEPDFREVKLAAVVDCKYCMPYEDNMPIYICRDLKVNLQAIWQEDKHFE